MPNKHINLVKLAVILILIVTIVMMEIHNFEMDRVADWVDPPLKYKIKDTNKLDTNHEQETKQTDNDTLDSEETDNKILDSKETKKEILDSKDVEKLEIVKRIDDWGNGVRFAQWKHPSEEDKKFPEDWVKMLQTLLQPGCNIVDIGAHGGDTTIPLAVASRGGTVVAVEMGPPYQLLTVNVRLNSQFHIDTYKKAVSNREGYVYYQSGCNGCNGGISSSGHTDTKVPSVRLSPFLHSLYPDTFINNIGLVKIDTEGHDAVILEDMLDVSPPVIWMEWFAGFRVGTPGACSEGSRRIFNAAAGRGYVVLHPTLPLRKVQGCHNKYYQKDLLLLRKDIVEKFLII